jgi:hypothetical protein
MLADREQVHQEAHLRAHRIDHTCARFQMPERPLQVAVDTQLAQVGTELHESGDTGEAGIWLTPVDLSRVWTPHRSTPLMAVSALAASYVPTHLPGASRVFESCFHTPIRGAREAFFSSTESILSTINLDFAARSDANSRIK